MITVKGFYRRILSLQPLLEMDSSEDEMSEYDAADLDSSTSDEDWMYRRGVWKDAFQMKTGNDANDRLRLYQEITAVIDVLCSVITVIVNAPYF